MPARWPRPTDSVGNSPDAARRRSHLRWLAATPATAATIACTGAGTTQLRTDGRSQDWAAALTLPAGTLVELGEPAADCAATWRCAAASRGGGAGFTRHRYVVRSRPRCALTACDLLRPSATRRRGPERVGRGAVAASPSRSADRRTPVDWFDDAAWPALIGEAWRVSAHQRPDRGPVERAALRRSSSASYRPRRRCRRDPGSAGRATDRARPGCPGDRGVPGGGGGGTGRPRPPCPTATRCRVRLRLVDGLSSGV